MSTAAKLLSNLEKAVEQLPSIYQITSGGDFVTLSQIKSFKSPTSILPKRAATCASNLSNTIVFKKPLQREFIVNKDVIPVIDEIIKTISANEDLSNDFFNEYDRKLKEYSQREHKYDLIAALLLISEPISKKFNIDVPFDLITNKVLLDPSYILMETHIDDNTFLDKLNTLRTLSVNLLIYGDSNNTKRLMHCLISIPQLFAEYSHRLVTVQMQIDLTTSSFEVLTRALMYIMTYYQTLDNLDDKQQKAVNSARMGLFMLINNYLVQDDIMIRLFNEDIFIDSFFSQVYEPEVAPFIISHITRYVMKKDSFKNTFMTDKLMCISKYVAQNLSDVRVVEIGAELYTLISSAMLFSESYVDFFSPLLKEVISGIVTISKCKAADSFLCSVINMITISTKYTLTTPDVIALQTAIATVYEDEPSQQIFIRILQLIAGTPVANISPTFQIRQPKALRLLIMSFLNSKLIETVVDFLAKLLQASIENCESAHYGGFDICLIDILFSLRTGDMSKKVLVAKIYSLLMLISTQISSVAVVRKFVSLLNPIEGRFLPFYHQITVKLLNNMLQSSKKKPVAVVPLVEESYFELVGLNSNDINEGFTYSTWLFVNSSDPKYKSQLILFNGIEDNRIVILLNGKEIIIVIEMDGDQWSGKLDVPLPLNEWFNFNITFVSDYDRDQTIVSSSINQGDVRSLYFPLIQFGAGPVKTKIGGQAFESIPASRISMIGPFGVFPSLTKSQILSVVDAGPQGSIPSNIKPLFYMIPREVDGNVHLMEVSKSKVTSKTPSIKYSHTLSFAETLVSRCGIDTLLPLFAQWDLTFTNNERVPYLPEISIDVLENCFAANEEAQTVFAESKGFDIISHLVRSSDEKNITYALYCRFFALMGVLTSEVAQRSLIQDILMNVEIWIRSDAVDHLRIIKHWARVLFPSRRFIKVCDFGFLLSILSIYYWYDNEPKNGFAKYEKRCRGQRLNVSECRKCILAIAHMVARVKFTADDFKLLISHILTVGALQQNIDLLYLLRELIDDESVPLLKSESPVELIALLQYLLNLKNEVIVSSLIATVIDAHRKKLFNSMTIVDHLDIILHQLTSAFVSKSLLIMLVELAGSNVPELFPICSWMAANIGNKALKYMLTNLKAGPQYNLSHNWSQWLAVAMYKSEPEMKRTIVRFLVESSGKDLGQLFAVVDVVGKALGEDSDVAKHSIIQEAGKQVSKGNDAVPIDEYVKILKHFVFFREGENGSNALQSLYQNSPYVEMKPKSSSRVRMHHGTPPRNLCNSPKRKQARKARHSLRPSAILQFTEKTENYSPLLAEQALAVFNPVSNIIPTNTSFKSRRVSMLTMGPRKYDYETHREPDKKVVSMMPGEMDKKIAEVAEKDYIYTFGLRFSKSGQWLDLDLAEQFLDIYTTFPYPAHAQIALAIASYLIRFGNPKATLVTQITPKNEPTMNGGLSLIAHHAEISEVEVSLPFEKASYEKSAFDFSQSLPTLFADKNMNAASLRLLKKTLRSQTVNSTRAYDIFGMISDQIVAMSSNSVNETNDKISQRSIKAEKSWHQFWRCNTVEHAPWFNSLPPNVRTEIHYKRDNTLCPFLVPIKMKRNYKYTDHKDASLLRDTGNQSTAEIALDKYRKSLQDEYEKNAPLQLFEVKEETVNDIDSEEPKEKKYSGNDCIIELPCEIIKNKSNKKATFALLADAVVITYDNGRVKVINLNIITGLFLRTRFHHPTAIEIFTSNGKSVFINFPNILAIPILKHFRHLDMPSLKLHQYVDFQQFADEHKLTNKWVNREISNFEYLMHLNLLSGRTFNDVSQYPIVPWVISDYDSNTLDLSDPSVYRDLSKPIGALDEERLQQLRDKMRTFIMAGLDPYLFSSGYSCPLSVYLWLVRMEPFSTLHIDIQSGKFDHAARLFQSISTSWKISKTHMNDFKELIPEFYTQPEFLVNANSFDLGNAYGKEVNDVELPPWAESTYDFIYKNRKALESDYVSKNLKNWIDLVWGYKQTGKEAEKADNIFVPQMYPNIWTSKRMKDPQVRAQTEAMLCHVGQIPPQLFVDPHPERMSDYAKTSSLARPVSVSLDAKLVIDASVAVTKSNKFRITTLDETGLINIAVFDASNLNKLSKNALAKPRSRSGSDRVITSDSHSWKATRRSTFGNDIVEIPVCDFNSTSKTIKQFGSIRPTKSIISTASANDGSIFLVGSQPNEMYRVIPSGPSISLASRQRSSITALASDGNWLLTANNDAVISLFSVNDASKPKITIPSFTSSVISCAISSQHQQAVCGTKDSTLIIISLTDSCIARTVNMGGKRPMKILITKGWGFIVVYSTDITTGVLKHFLSVFNINGEKIRDVEIASAVRSWTAYTDAKGFDFIVMTDENGCVYHFEAFYANIGQSIFTVKYDIGTVKYLIDEGIIAAITCDGKAVFIPSTI